MSLGWGHHPCLLPIDFESEASGRHCPGDPKGSWGGEDRVTNLLPSQVCWPPRPHPPQALPSEPSKDSHAALLKMQIGEGCSSLLPTMLLTLQMGITDHTAGSCLIKKKTMRVKLGFRTHSVW